MRLQTRVAVSAFMAIGVLGTSLLAPSGAGPKGKPKSFTVEGRILTMAPFSHMEFMASCPELPATQGLGAYVVEVPEDFARQPMRATVESTAVSLDPGIELTFYSSSCDRSGGFFYAPPVNVPAGTAFIVVEDIRGINVEFELTLTQQR